MPLPCPQCQSVLDQTKAAIGVEPGAAVRHLAEDRDACPAWHELKTWPAPFADLIKGNKTFEFRREDVRRFSVGDVLRLREWTESEGTYTGRTFDVEVTHLLRGPEFGVPVGMAILSVRPFQALLP
jgi:hypothetical protein